MSTILRWVTVLHPPNSVRSWIQTHIGVFEKLRGQVGIRLGHGEGEVVLRLAGAEVELVLDLDFQDCCTVPYNQNAPAYSQKP